MSKTPTEQVLGDYFQDLGDGVEDDIADAMITWLKSHPYSQWRVVLMVQGHGYAEPPPEALAQRIRTGGPLPPDHSWLRRMKVRHIDEYGTLHAELPKEDLDEALRRSRQEDEMREPGDWAEESSPQTEAPWIPTPELPFEEAMQQVSLALEQSIRAADQLKAEERRPGIFQRLGRAWDSWRGDGL